MATEEAQAHIGQRLLIANELGYSTGRFAACSCGWTSPEHPVNREGLPLVDFQQHLLDVGLRPKELTT